MPRCSHKEAVCVIGDFWTCKTAGCKNGPPAAKHPGGWRYAPDTTWYIAWPPEWDEDAKTPVDRR